MSVSKSAPTDRRFASFSRTFADAVDATNMLSIDFWAVARRATATLHALPYSAAAFAIGGVMTSAGCGNPRSAEAAPEPPKPAPVQDATWATKAREAYFAEFVGTRYGQASPGDPTTRGWPVAWPFEGFAPEPAWLTSMPLRAPVASVEWRFSQGLPVESFVDGDPALLRAALDMAPPWRSSPTAAANQTPPTDWTWPAGFATAWSAESDLNRTSTRWLWCDAFADVYEIAPGGPYLVAVDLPGGEIETSVFWLDATGAPDARAKIEWRTQQDARPLAGAAGALTQLATTQPSVNRRFHRTDRGSTAVLASADFDANGSPDFVHLTGTPRGGSLGIAYSGVLVLTEATSRRAHVIELTTNGIGFIDIDQNNRSEMLLAHEGVHVPKCEDGFPHDFIVTDLIGFQRLWPVDLAGIDRVRKGSFTGTFPAWRTVDGDPTLAFRPLVSGNLKREMHTSGFPAYKRR